MKQIYSSIVLVILSINSALLVGSDLEGSKFCFRRLEQFNTSEGGVNLEWMVDSDLETVIFNLEIEPSTKNAFGLGLSHYGKLTKQAEPKDFILYGIGGNGKGYLLDMSIRANYEDKLTITKDLKQDYNLVSIQERAGHLKISFWRKWNTGDSRDIIIDNSLLHILWFHLPYNLTGGLPITNFSSAALFHSLETYLLDPVYEPRTEEEVKTWVIRQDVYVPNQPTTYWCQVHEFPETLTTKLHIIGFRTKLDGELAKRHTHHIVLYKCVTNMAPESERNDFQRLVSDNNGSDCFYTKEWRLLRERCRTFIYVWGYGGKEFSLPHDVGFPLGENDQFLMETHFDNPHSLANLKIRVEVQISFTRQLRTHDGGLVMTGYAISPSLIIPPKSENMVVYGHCNPQCTGKWIPNEGINVFGVLLHSHTAGRKIAVHHFSPHAAEKENSSLLYDDYYDFQFQAARMLIKRRKIYPGDHLVTKCTYNTKWKNGTTLGGLSTQQEMCLGFLLYYPKIPNFFVCTSQLSLPDTMRKFGVEKVQLSSGVKDYWQLVVAEPNNFANKTFQDVLDNDVSWTEEFRETVENLYDEDYHSHPDNQC